METEAWPRSSCTNLGWMFFLIAAWSSLRCAAQASTCLTPRGALPWNVPARPYERLGKLRRPKPHLLEA
jgi:hypothetical protein